jgi:ATP-dependent Lon protease
MKAIDEIRDLNVLIGYICQFLPFSRQEKYTLMETSSLKDRGLTFIDYFLHYKEEIKLQIEMTERFSEKANKLPRGGPEGAASGHSGGAERRKAGIR